MALTKKHIKILKERLLAHKSELMEEMDGLKKNLNYGDDIDSFDQEADEAEEYANYLSVKQVFEERIARADVALSRIEEGTYEVCLKCEKKMLFGFLKENPTSAICLSCKKLARDNK